MQTTTTTRPETSLVSIELMDTATLLRSVFRDIPESQRPSEQTVRKSRVTGRGMFADLPFIKISGRVFYRRTDVEKWASAFPAYKSTSELHQGRKPA